jgi:regulation of enolase protein 1 (concanavalin A-like superfamily)
VGGGRAGLEWDEFGNGCMHKAASQNHPRTHPYPLWLKLVRQGDRFSSGISYDGVAWTNLRQTGKVPGIAESVDIGLAAGACDQRAYTVEFQDWTIQAEDP